MSIQFLPVPEQLTPMILFHDSETGEECLYDAFHNGEAVFYCVNTNTSEYIGKECDIIAISDDCIARSPRNVSIFPTMHCKECNQRMFIKETKDLYPRPCDVTYRCNCGMEYTHHIGWNLNTK